MAGGSSHEIPGVDLAGCIELDMTGNTISGFICGVMLDSPVDYRPILSENSITASKYLLVKVQRVRLEFSESWVLARSLNASYLSFDVQQWMNYEFYSYYNSDGEYYSNLKTEASELKPTTIVWATRSNYDLRFYALLVETAGNTVTRKTLDIDVHVFSPSTSGGGYSSNGVDEISVQVPASYRWVESIG